MYILKLLKQNFRNLIISSFEKMGENGPRVQEEIKEQKVPKEVKKESIKKLLEKGVEPKLKTNEEIIEDTLGPDYIGKEGVNLKENFLEKPKEQNGFSGEIISNLDNKEIKILNEVLGNKSIKQASSGEIYTLKQEGFDLSKIFLKDSSGKFSKGKGEMKSGNDFIVDFYGNKDIDRIIGIGDILDINNISEVSVNGIKGERKSSPRPGFYAGRKYLAIHENFNIKILKEEKFDGEEFNKSIYSRFSNVRGKELESWLYTHLNSGDSSIKIPFNANEDKKLFKQFIEKNFGKELGFDFENNILKTKDGKSLVSKQEIISSHMIPKNASELMKIPGFAEKLEKVCSRLGINKNDLLLVMGAESNFNPQAVNRGSGASGLIQFMPSTAKGLGTTVYAIRQMGAVEQLSLVERYFKPYSGKLHNVVDLYKAVFFPISLKHLDNSWVFKSNNLSASKVANQNPIISKYSTRADGYIDGNAFRRYVMNHVASKTIVYEDIQNDVSEITKEEENNEELLFNNITFYHGEIDKSFDITEGIIEDITKSGKVIIERGTEKLSQNEIGEIKKMLKQKLGDKIEIVLNLGKSYGGQIDV